MSDTKRQRRKYDKDLPRKMYTYFLHYDEGDGAPSFNKFAVSAGLLPEDLDAFRQKREFDACYRACSEIRKDYLIDRALNRRFDPSFVKFLLTSEFGVGEDLAPEENLAVTFEVVK